MAHIPMDDVKKLYRQSGGSWSGLENAVESDAGTKNGIADYEIIDLKHALKGMNGQSFPDSPEKLYQTLNDKLQGMPHEPTKARAAYGNDR